MKPEISPVNLSKNAQTIRMLIGLALVGSALYQKKWLTGAGLFLIGTGVTGYCPLTNQWGIISSMLADPQERLSRSEMADLPLADMEDSGGYRTGNPISGIRNDVRHEGY